MITELVWDLPQEHLLIEQEVPHKTLSQRNGTLWVYTPAIGNFHYLCPVCGELWLTCTNLSTNSVRWRCTLAYCTECRGEPGAILEGLIHPFRRELNVFPPEIPMEILKRDFLLCVEYYPWRLE